MNESRDHILRSIMNTSTQLKESLLNQIPFPDYYFYCGHGAPEALNQFFCNAPIKAGEPIYKIGWSTVSTTSSVVKAGLSWHCQNCFDNFTEHFGQSVNKPSIMVYPNLTFRQFVGPAIKAILKEIYAKIKG